MVEGWYRGIDESDFTLVPPLSSPLIGGRAKQRIQKAGLDADSELSWRGRESDPASRISVQLEVLSGNSKIGKTKLQIIRPTVDIPVTLNVIRIQTPKDSPYPFERGDNVEQALRVLLMYESAVAAYCEWRGWSAPGPLPRTRAEQAWVAEHGEPETPEWVGRLQVPKPRPVKLDPVLSVLRECADKAGGDVDDRVECVVATVQRLPKAKAKPVMAGWNALVSNLGTQAHWDAAVSVPGWDWLSGDVFLDLRAHTALLAPQVAESGDVEAFRRHVAAIEDEEEVGIAGGMTDLLNEVAEEREIDTSGFPDPWTIRE